MGEPEGRMLVQEDKVKKQDQEEKELEEAMRRSLNIHTGTQAVRELDRVALHCW